MSMGAAGGGAGVLDPGASGYMVRTVYGASVPRTIQGGIGVNITDGSGVDGDTSVALANTAVEPGSYSSTDLTVDQQGRITAAGDGSGGGSSYLKYVALLTQADINTPVATVLENTLGGTVEWAYFATGRYTATLTNGFPTNKTVVLMTANIRAVGGMASTYCYSFASASVMNLRTYDDGFTLSDDLMTNASIEIRVYP